MTMKGVKVKGRKFDVEVKSNGNFAVTVDGEVLEKDSLKKLKDAITKLVEKKPMDIPFIEFSRNYNDDDLEFRYGRIVSIHSGNNNFIVEWDDSGSREQHVKYRQDLLKRDTDIDKLIELHAAVKLAEKTKEEFLEAHRLDVNLGDQ